MGHEVDITLCDLVADHRAATPSAAAEAAVPVLAEARAEAAAMLLALREALVRQVQRRRDRVERAAHDLHVGVTRGAERRAARMSAIAGKLHALSPLATLARGYSVARDESGATLASAVGLRARTRFRSPSARRNSSRDHSLGARRRLAHVGPAVMSYETDIARIETIVGELERSEVPLDDALRLFEEGIERLRAASAALMQAEARVRKLIEESDGGFTLADFES